jgi:cyclophilin family peptidyl-prolyl cis-trans isomerase/protein-disulfide isomerase
VNRRLAAGSLVACALLGACISSTPSAPATVLGPTRTPLQLGPAISPTPPPATGTPLPPTPTLLPLPDISASDWSVGPSDAAVTLLIYADFQPSSSASLLRILFGIVDRHPDDLRLVFRHLPQIPSFDKDSLAGQAVEAAGAQGAFWPMARALVERHAEWSVLSPGDFTPWLVSLAGALGLNVDEFQSDLQNGRYAAFMMATYQEAIASGLPGGPLLYLNGSLVRLPPTEINLESAVRLEALSARAFAQEPPMALRSNADYFATFVFDGGEVEVQLLPDVAPQAVNSFVFLARQGWFDGTTIYRVVPGGWIEAGDPSATGLGDPGYHLPDEIDPSWTFDEAGRVALASVGPGTSGSRFLITLAPLPDLNGTRTIFGRVLRGLDYLQGLSARDPLENLLDPGIVLRSVRIEVEL